MGKNFTPHFFSWKWIIITRETVLQNFRKFLCVVSKKFHSKGLTLFIILSLIWFGKIKFPNFFFKITNCRIFFPIWFLWKIRTWNLVNDIKLNILKLFSIADVFLSKLIKISEHLLIRTPPMAASVYNIHQMFLWKRFIYLCKYK